jgi:anti-anti-sigma factor
LALKIRSTENRTFSRIVELVGRLDNETVAALDEELNRIAASDVTVIVFDLAGLEYISSVGLRSIFRIQKVMAARSGKMLLVNMLPQVEKVFEIVKAVDVKSVFASTEELDRYLDVMQRKVIDGE